MGLTSMVLEWHGSSLMGIIGLYGSRYVGLYVSGYTVLYGSGSPDLINVIRKVQVNEGLLS